MRRRDFIAGASAMTAWPVATRAQVISPVVGFVNVGTADGPGLAGRLVAFRAGLREIGYFEGQNVTVEYHWLGSQYDHLPALMNDLVRRRVAVIVSVSTLVALAAKAATAAIPIVFGVGEDPVRIGLVASLARPGANATGINFLNTEINAKRLALLHELVPKTARVAVLVNPANGPISENVLHEVQDAARVMGLSLEALKASTAREIEEAFATIALARIDALFVAGDAYFSSRQVQIVTLATRLGIVTSVPDRDYVRIGGLMSYGTDLADLYRQIGAYAGQILKGAKPADLPVMQPTKLTLSINLTTARAIGLEVSPTLLAQADEVIE